MLFYSVIFLLFLLSFYFYRKFGNYVPILMYHRIASIPGDRNALPPDRFKAQLDYLAANGFTTVTMRMVCAYYQHGSPLPPKPVLLTFDDGYLDNLLEALPLLNERQMTAAVFPIANWVGKENKWENFHKAPTRTMDWNQLKKWQAAGLEIASHTMDHPFLSHCAPEQLRDELHKSKRILEKKLDTPVEFLCYPYGDFNKDAAVAAKNAGYLGAFAIFDRVPLGKLDLYALPRIPIPAKQKMWEFKLKISSIHMIFILLRQWERRLKRALRKNKK